MTRRRIARGFWVGVAVGVGLTVVLNEARYVDWAPAVAPVDAQPLRIRQDAKGDGQFHAPRSGGRVHRGIDLAAPLESPVRAIRSGAVIEVGTHRGLGRFVELEHRGRLTSLYAHLTTTDVDVGQRVAQGQAIGTVGKTGNARHARITPHVHLEVARDGERVDPMGVGLSALVETKPDTDDDADSGE